MQLRSFPVRQRPVGLTPDLTLTVSPSLSPWSQAMRLLQPNRWWLSIGAFAGGTLASGQPLSSLSLLTMALAVLLVGPLLTSAGHVIGAFFDRERASLDPRTSVPAFSSDALVASLGLLSLLALLVGHWLGSFAFSLTVGVLALHLALNAPPLRLRRLTWWNGFGFGLATLGAPWLIGGDGAHGLSATSLLLAASFTFGALGLHLLASLHRGVIDRQAGLRTLAALFGPEVGALIAALVIDTGVLGAAILCLGNQNPTASIALIATLVLQVILQLVIWPRIVRRERGRRAFLPAVFALYLIAMLVAAASVGHASLEF